MRNVFKTISAIAIISAFTATFSFADAMCYDLCMSCRDGNRAENCDKIETTCNCPFVIDSAKSKNMGIELTKRKLVSELAVGCDKAVCARTVTFQDGYYKNIEKGRTTLTRFELLSKAGDAEQRASNFQPSAIKAANATVDSLTRRRSFLPIPPMSMECTQRCDDCAGKNKKEPATMTPADSLRAAQAAKAAAPAAKPDSAKAPVDTVALAKAREDSIAKADSLRKAFCRVTETSCQCKAHEENTLAIIALDKELAAKTAIADSLNKIRAELLREDMARIIADSLQARCNTQGKCRYSITYTSKEIALLEMRVEEDKPEPAPAAAAPAQTPAQAPAELAKPEPEPASAPAEPAEQPAEEVCPQAEAPADTADSEKEKKKDRIFYKVTEITYGNFGERSYYAKGIGRINNLEEETGYEAGVTYLLRWYFYDGGAFSVGLGTFYHYKKFNYEYTDDEKYGIYYHNIGADIPISFRLGVPKIPILKPFISQTFNFHKPIFEIYKIETPPDPESDDDALKAFASEATGIDFGMFDDVQSRFNAAKDLTFSVWLGFGLQITRHFSAEYQMNFGVGTIGRAHKYVEDDYWRIVVDFAW